MVQVNLGNMYVQGLGVPRSLHTAMGWYKKAAEQYPEHVAELIQHLQERIDAGDSAMDGGQVSMPGMMGGDAGVGAGASVTLPLTAMTPAGTAAAHLPTKEFVVELDRGRSSSGGGSSSSSSSSRPAASSGGPQPK